MKKAFLIYPHQLFENIDLLRMSDCVYIIEEPLYFTEYTFHKQKLILHRASMKAYEVYLHTQGIHTKYIENNLLNHTEDIGALLSQAGVTYVELYDTTDDWLSSRLTHALDAHNISHILYESPMFITSSDECKMFFEDRKGERKYFMNDFYIWQRKRLGILLDNNGKPLGGKWSYDEENRKKLPKDIVIPHTFSINTSSFLTEAIHYVEKYFPSNYGDSNTFWCPVTHDEAKEYLAVFLKNRFEFFGPYEDAMSTDSPTVFHSTISPLLNCGLLTPQYVLQEVITYAEIHSTPLQSVEGFVRQVIGWREYIRAMYILEGRRIRSKNYFDSKNRLPKSFWNGTTGIEPIDHHIHILHREAYTHHIPRLMVLGNFMNLCHIHPHDVYTWFSEMYIDAYDWVMVPNVYSMALYADGGLLTTKPYISSSNYILKMSDFKRGGWCDIFDSLFWNFVGLHFEKLQKEGRLGFIGIQYQKLTQEKKIHHTHVANQFLTDFIHGNPKNYRL